VLQRREDLLNDRDEGALLHTLLYAATVRTFHLEWDEPIEGTGHGEAEYEITKSEWESDESRVTTLGIVNSDSEPTHPPEKEPAAPSPTPKSSDGPQEVEDAAQQEAQYPADETNEG